MWLQEAGASKRNTGREVAYLLVAEILPAEGSL